MFVFYGFGIEFTSNINLAGLSREMCLPTLFELIKVEVQVKIDSDTKLDSTANSMVDEGSAFIFNFYGEIEYTIFQNKIVARSKSAELLLSTFYNIPISVILILNNMLLLHASAFHVGNKLYPICAEKGTGKSTFTAYAISKGARLFCDDTLAITFVNDTIFAFRGANFVKLNEDAIEAVGLSNVDYDNRNIAGKIYCELPLANACYMPIESIYFMSVGDINIDGVKSPLLARTMLLSNVVGVAWLGSMLKHRIVNSQIFTKASTGLDLYKFTTPRTWEAMEVSMNMMLDDEGR